MARHFSYLLFALLSTLLPLLTSAADSPVLATEIGPDCLEGFTHSGRVAGTNITIAGVPTYYSKPSKRAPGPKKVLLFLADIYSPFYVNNQLLQDYLASEGFHVLGIDYFFGDPIQAHDGEPGFNQTAWILKSRAQADESLPKWVDAVRKAHGDNAKYTAVGYCFGGPYAMQISATDQVVAGAFAHPSGLTEDHFEKLTKPLLLSCAEADGAFQPPALNRAVDILTQKKAKYHVQIFSGVTHGFATRANLDDENAVWAKDESARSVVEWFKRFSK